MSSPSNDTGLNGKLQTVADLEKAANDLEKKITILNKSFLRQLFKGFASLTNALEGAEPGIFSTVIKWYRLYLRVQISIDPGNEKFLNYFEKSIPTAITYIIGCLQHKTKEIQNYHYSLLEIIEGILENVTPNIFNKIINLETGTIACLWNPIDYAGDYNTQLKALKILSLFLKHLDNDKQNEELKSIKWTNLNLFQDKLKTVIQESKLLNVFENTARKLLNNYNMNLSKNVLVYSFYCKSLILGTKYKFYKPLNLDKFWIDINYCPQTLSFCGRLKLDSESKYEHINVILKIQNIKMENQQLLINYEKPGDFSKYCKEISDVSENFIQLTLNHEEEQRLKENHFVVDYFNKSNIVDSENPPSRRTSDVFQKSYNLLIGSSPNETVPEQNKNNKSDSTTSDGHDDTNKQTKPVSSEVTTVWMESPKTSRIRSDTLEKQPIRKMPNRKRKFFLSLLEEDVESEEETKKASKKKSKVKKSRQPKISKKLVCKVSPIVDLTGIDDIPNKENVEKSSVSIVHLTNDLKGGDEMCISSSNPLTSQQCANILKNVSDIYNVGDTTYAEPCQSYRNFKTQRVPRIAKNSLNTKPAKTRGRNAKKDTSNIENIAVDKENLDPNILKFAKNFKGKQAISNNKRMVSPNVLGTPMSNEVVPTKKPRPTKDNTVYTADMEIDLTADDPKIIDPQKQHLKPKPSDSDISTVHQLLKSSSYENILNDDLLDYENVRTDPTIANPTAISTPNITKLYCSNNATPTSTMNISDINDSDMELTQLTKKSNYIMDKFKNKELSHKKPQLNVVEQILNDWNFDDVESIQKSDGREQCSTESNTLEVVVPNNDENNVLQKCIVFQKRGDNDDNDSDSSDNDDIDDCNQTHSSIDFLKRPDFMINQDFVIMQNMPLNMNTNYYNLDNIWNTPDKNNMIVRNVSTKSSTECQVTPNALILRQIQVSTKEAVLVADLKQKHQSQYCKAKKSLNSFYNHRTICSSNHQTEINGIVTRIDPANEKGHLDNNNNLIYPYQHPPKRTYLELKTKDKQMNTNNSLIPLNHKNLNVPKGNHINEADHFAATDNETAIVPYKKTLNTCMDNSSGSGKDLKYNNSIVNNRCHYNEDEQQNLKNCENTLEPSSVTKTISLQENDNNENINFDNSFLYRNSILYNEHGILDTTDNYNNEMETIANKRSSQYNNYSAENIENLNNNSINNLISLFSDENNLININTGGASLESENNQEFFENELSQLVDDYNSRMQIRIENARRLCLSNTADLYVQKVREITESVLRKSEEQKKELELLRENIERLVTRIEWQYQIFIKKSKQYDNYKEITERSLDALAELNVQHRITSEYQEMTEKLKIDQNEVLQEVWQNFINKKKKDYLNNIDNLSKI